MPGMKYHPHGSVLFVTFSIEEGLLLLANPLTEAIIESCLARASTLYPTLVNHLLIEATHVHLVLTVENPADVPEFMRHFKAETSHMINGLLGRNKRTIWCEGYDSPILLSLAKAILKIAYLYANPAKDNLVDSIDNYPGFSTWRMFRRGETTKRWRHLHRPQCQPLPPQSHNLAGYTREAKRILAETKGTNTFTLFPDAWMKAFKIFDPAEQKKVNERIVARIRTLEERARQKRLREKKQVLGVDRLKHQVFDTSYRPCRSGRKTWCLSERRHIRQPFINFLKRLFASAREVRKRWFLGDFSQPYPLGLYPPSMPKLGEPLSINC